MTERKTLLEFPCQFSIKAIGRGDDLDRVVYALIQPHVPGLSSTFSSNSKQATLTLRPSGKGNYLAITMTITAISQTQLDAIYQALTDCKQVIMAL